MMEEILSYWPWFAIAAAVVLTVFVSIHAILTKRDSHAAVAWVAVLWFVPFFGPLAYYLFGINRIKRHARRLRNKSRQPTPPTDASGNLAKAEAPPLPPEAEHLAPLVRLGATVTSRPLLPGNKVQPLRDGDEAYPMMLTEIENAKHTIGLGMYIFRNDDTGRLFAEALGRAVARGVNVRVLIDDLGSFAWYSSILGPLTLAKVRTERFLPAWLSRSITFANLRNHRKLLIIDGRLGFTGGINICDDHWRSKKPAEPVQDWHFRLEGPIVTAMQQVFVDDWKFATGESLKDDPWLPKLESCGSVLARGVSSGPDEDIEKVRLVFLGALASARKSVRIVTPYFLPDAALISALAITALRGVQVDIHIPMKNNLRLVQWATMAQLWQVLEYGCKVWHTPEPFTHTKLMIVDGVWTIFGSANWDPRSMLLNFEFDIECYDRELATTLETSIMQAVNRPKEVTMATLNRRSNLVKLRDGIAWLLSPYL